MLAGGRYDKCGDPGSAVDVSLERRAGGGCPVGFSSVATGFRLAVTPRARFRGLLRTSPPSSPLVIAPCRDIHTFGMSAPIDVAFASADGVVLMVERGVEPGRRIRCAEAAMVVERFAVAKPWLSEGDRMGFSLA